MSDILKIHFYLFFREHEIGRHMKLTWNCWFDSDDKKNQYVKGSSRMNLPMVHGTDFICHFYAINFYC